MAHHVNQSVVSIKFESNNNNNLRKEQNAQKERESELLKL
jgi:hypothetical protein